MGRFSHLNPESPENEKFWGNIKDEVFKLLNEINEQVFNGEGKVELLGRYCQLKVRRSYMSAFCSLTIRPRVNAEELIWEVEKDTYVPVVRYFNSKDLVSELEKATVLLVDRVNF